MRERLRQPPSLLHVENADTEALAEAAGGLVAALPGCAVLVTGRYQGLGASVGWAQVPLRPFDEGAALAQLGEGLGEEEARMPEGERRSLVAALGHLPLAIHLTAGTCARVSQLTSLPGEKRERPPCIRFVAQKEVEEIWSARGPCCGDSR